MKECKIIQFTLYDAAANQPTPVMKNAKAVGSYSDFPEVEETINGYLKNGWEIKSFSQWDKCKWTFVLEREI